MADTKFFHKIEGGLTLAKIAEMGEVRLSEGADANKTFQDVADLEKATPDDVSWAFIPSVREALKNTKAGAVIVPEKFKELVPAGTIALVSEDAHRSYGLVASAFYPRVFEAGISPAAHVDPTAKIGNGCRIAAGAVIEKMWFWGMDVIFMRTPLLKKVSKWACFVQWGQMPLCRIVLLVTKFIFIPAHKWDKMVLVLL